MTSKDKGFIIFHFIKKEKKGIQKLVLLILLVLFLFKNASSQSIYSNHYTTQNGLANNVVFDMLQDAICG
jgi:hypothetical protein